MRAHFTYPQTLNSTPLMTRLEPFHSTPFPISLCNVLVFQVCLAAKKETCLYKWIPNPTEVTGEMHVALAHASLF